MPNGRFAYAHLLNTHLTPLRRPFLDRSPPHFLSAAAPRRFEAGVCKQTSGGHLPSFRAAPRIPACASSRSCRHYYSTFWDGGVPYYYADDNYYQWDGNVGQYETVNPPPEVLKQANAQQSVTELFAYPKNGQSTEQQAQDKQECRSWAAAQTGYTSMQPGGTSASLHAGGATSPATREQYLRAQGVCLGARG